MNAHNAPLFSCSVCGSKYDRCFVAYQLIIQLSWCEVSNDVDSFLLNDKAVQSTQVENFFLAVAVRNEDTCIILQI